MSKMTVFVVLFVVAFAAGNPTCSEPKDADGLTCSAYLKSGVGTFLPDNLQPAIDKRTQCTNN